MITVKQTEPSHSKFTDIPPLPEPALGTPALSSNIVDTFLHPKQALTKSLSWATLMICFLAGSEHLALIRVDLGPRTVYSANCTAPTKTQEPFTLYPYQLE